MWQTLTPEILCQVFECAIQNAPLHTFEPYLFPWHLGRICSAWRDTFISFPKIWTYFMIDFEQNRTASLKRIQLSLEMVQLCLDRSKDCPIRFMFLESNCPQSLEILRTLAIHSTRWKHAYFKMDAAKFSTLIEVKDKLPILHSLCLIVPPDSGLASGDFPDLFDNTPQLRHLSFNSYPLRKLDWSSLCTIHMTIKEDTIAAPYFITQTSSKLEELFIDGTLPNDILPLTFPSLKRLGIQFEGFLGFLESLKTPALEELCFIAWDDVSLDDPALNRIASRFIREQGIPLNKIAIYSKCINMTTILLRYVPDTTRHVYLHSAWKVIVSALSSCSAARYLESVTYEYWSEYKFLWPMLELAESWREQSIVAGSKGIGPFENMHQFSIELTPLFMGEDKSFVGFTDRLKKPFEECGVKCSVRPMPRRVYWNINRHFYFDSY